MIDEPWALPVTWRWARFDEVARVASNLVDPAEYPDSPHVAPNHIESETGRLLPCATVREDGVTSAKHRFFPGQVLYSKIRPYLAKVVVADFEGLCSADMYPIESELDSRFLKWWMLTREFTRRAAGEQARTVLPKINVRALSALPIPVPPLAEQRRIIEILEDHLSCLDAAAHGLRAADRRLTVLKSSRAEWARRTALSAGDPVSLAALARDSGYGTSTKCVVGGRGPVVVRIPNLVDGRIDLTDEKRVEETTVDVSSAMLKADDVLIVRTNGSRQLIGRTAVVQPGVDAAFASYLIRYRLDTTRVRADWVHLMMQAPSTRAALESMAASSAGQYNLGLTKLDGVQLPAPDLADQDLLLSDCRAVAEAAARAVGEVQRTSVHGLALRRALLAAAFSGQLT